MPQGMPSFECSLRRTLATSGGSAKHWRKEISPVNALSKLCSFSEALESAPSKQVLPFGEQARIEPEYIHAISWRERKRCRQVI